MVSLLYIGTHGKQHGQELILIDLLEHGVILVVEKVEEENSVELSLQQLLQPQNRVEQVSDTELLLLLSNNL